MPYKDAEEQRRAMRRIMKEYRKRLKEQMTALEKAIMQGDTKLAKHILSMKPSEFWKAQKEKKKRKQRAKEKSKKKRERKK